MTINLNLLDLRDGGVYTSIWIRFSGVAIFIPNTWKMFTPRTNMNTLHIRWYRVMIHPMRIIGHIIPGDAYIFVYCDAYAMHHQHASCLN